LRVFGSSRALRRATVEEIAAVPGIGRSLAERIRTHLDA
jgi:excinuclease UvrABC nuclease subunit